MSKNSDTFPFYPDARATCMSEHGVYARMIPPPREGESEEIRKLREQLREMQEENRQRK
ncbi:MAG: hypothetical protein WC551_06900 [Patescibacteria group bacterium]